MPQFTNKDIILIGSTPTISWREEKGVVSNYEQSQITVVQQEKTELINMVIFITIVMQKDIVSMLLQCTKYA